MSDAVLSAKGLAKAYRIGFWRKKVNALRDATFDVRANEVFGLVGPNGAGKTTTIKILTGLVSRDAGEGTLLGRPIGSVEARRALGYLPEQPYFYDYLTVGELLDYYGALYGMTAAARARRAAELIELVGLAHAQDRPIRKFSKGMMQRAGLAQALMHDPELVILDEPKTGLDPIGRAQVDAIIRELKARGKAVFFASHILPDVEKVCDRVGLMVGGRIVDVGPLDKLLNAQVLEVEIVVEGLGDEHHAALAALGAAWRPLGQEQLMITTPDSDRGRQALALVVKAGAAVRGYEERREHLEDLFIRMLQAGQGTDGGKNSAEPSEPR